MKTVQKMTGIRREAYAGNARRRRQIHGAGNHWNLAAKELALIQGSAAQRNDGPKVVRLTQLQQVAGGGPASVQLYFRTIEPASAKRAGDPAPNVVIHRLGRRGCLRIDCCNLRWSVRGGGDLHAPR